MRRALSTLCWLICFAALAALFPGPARALDEDERRLWQRAEEAQKSLDTGSLAYHDADMERYLEAVFRRLVPAERMGSLQVSVGIIRDRSLNAFVLPTGKAYVHIGLLAALDNEAQLATILAHEGIHALNRHQLQELRNAKDKTAFGAILGAMTGNLLTPFSQLGALASVMGYSREMESEADREGFRLLVRAGYDAAEAPKVFLALQKEVLAEKTQEPYFFASHPKLQQRVDNFNALLKAEPPGNTAGITNRESYLKTFAPLILDNAELDLKAGRVERARHGVERYLASRGECARAYQLLGECYRRDSKSPDLARARECYQKSASLDPGFAEPQRQLGLLAYKAKDRAEARRYLGEYLRLSAGAADRGYIEQMLNELK